MQAEYTRLITERDGILTELRANWLSARCDKDRTTWMGKINGNLDERLRLMKCRDTALTHSL